MQERENNGRTFCFSVTGISAGTCVSFPDPRDLLQFTTRPAVLMCFACCSHLLCTDENSLGKSCEVCYNNCQNGFREDKLYGSKK